MADENHLRIELLHSLGWMYFHRHSTHLWRAEIDSGNLVLPSDVQHGSSFSTPSDNVHLVIAGIFDPLGILSVEESTHDHSARLKFTFPEETLRAHLEATDRLARLDLDHLITTFLPEASRFGESFESSRDGREAIGSLPISRSVFQAPPHFQDAISALCRSAFCARADGGYRWSESVRPFMEAAHLWIGDQTRDEVREAELTEIWNTMPPRLRSLVTDNQEGGLDMLGLAMVMSHFWHEGRWHEKPECEDRLELGPDGLKGRHIPTAKEICRLYSDGKLGD